ncbi:MAG: 50S ribosomal protein L29 [Myxococcales bacterium]|nr:50S ribosomal protein L29 [Myxococcales bacterium]
MDLKELHECSAERLGELEQQLRREVFDARIKNFTNQLDDTAKIRRTRRDLARVKTLIRQRALIQPVLIKQSAVAQAQVQENANG